jgi:diguanylate cyclase (GGDEF)-like protein/PAS domain S-box-containing protein
MKLAYALEQQVDELLQLISLAPVAIIKLAPEGEIQMLNPMAVQLLRRIGLDPDSLSGVEILDALSPGLSDIWATSSGEVGLVSSSIHSDFLLVDGSRLNLLLRIVRPDGQCAVISIHDVTMSAEHERELERCRQQLSVVLERLEGYCVAMLNRDGSLAEWNTSIGRMLGSNTQRLVGAPFRTLLCPSKEAEQFPFFKNIEDAVLSNGAFRGEAPVRREMGKEIWGEFSLTPTVGGDGITSGYVVVIRDASARHDTQQQLLDDAMTDPLTGLLNRRGLALRLESLSHAPLSAETLASWIMLDIDHFKSVNDTYGHDIGDVVLRQIALLLKAHAREGDIVVRLGGEEFVVILPGASLSAAVAAAERFRSRLEALEFTTGSQTLHVTASFGVCAQTRELLWSAALRAADKALYKAKACGRNKVIAASGSTTVE